MRKIKQSKTRETQVLYKTKKTIKITAELIPEQAGGFTVYCPELDIYSQGEDIQDALKNIREAADIHIEEIGADSLMLRKVIRKELEMAV